jgi:hypothetical protein
MFALVVRIYFNSRSFKSPLQLPAKEGWEERHQLNVYDIYVGFLLFLLSPTQFRCKAKPVKTHCQPNPPSPDQIKHKLWTNGNDRRFLKSRSRLPWPLQFAYSCGFCELVYWFGAFLPRDMSSVVASCATIWT